MLSKKKIVIAIISLVVVAAIIWGAVEVKNYRKTIQIKRDENPLSQKQREVLTMNYTPVELGEQATLKRVIDNTHPLNLVNFYGNEPVETLWDSIPENQKPFTVILIIPGHTLLPGSEGALDFLETTADTCEENEIPYAIQNINGEIAIEERLPIAYLESRFASRHKYFFGLNAAELYNGITWRGEYESNNSQYVIDCIGLCSKYGTYFLWTDTNMNYDSGMVLEWFEKNEAFYTAFKNNSEYICLMNKESFGNPSTYSCMQGLWLAGLVGNWGVASDWWHWQVDGDKKSLFGEHDELVDNEWDMIMSYPENMYVQSMMLVMSAGGTCFKAEAPNFSTSVGGTPVGGFEYGISPLFDRILNGTITIPTRQEVLDKTKVAVLGYENYPNFNYNLAESNLYPSTGTYGIIPLLPSNLRTDEINVFNNNSVLLADSVLPQSDYNAEYNTVDGNTYLTNTGTQWFWINNVENARSTKSSTAKPILSPAEKLVITAQEHTCAVISERTDSLYFFISNYRTDKTEMIRQLTPEYMADRNWIQMTSEFLPLGDNGSPIGLDDTQKRTTVIELTGTLDGGAPLLEWLNDESGEGYQNRPYTHTEAWDEATKTLTVTIEHNGIVEFNVKLSGDAKTNVTQKNTHSYPITLSGADTSALVALVEAQKPIEKTDYNDYSFIKYNAALEKARVIIAEKTYSQEQVDAAVAELTNAQSNLLDISGFKLTLTQTDIASMTQEQGECFDALIREATSNLLYVDGRSQSIFYAEQYKNGKPDYIKKTDAMQLKQDMLTAQSD